MRVFLAQDAADTLNNSKKRRLVLALQPKDKEPATLLGAIVSKVGEIRVEGQQDTRFCQTRCKNAVVWGTFELLVPNGLHVMSVSAQEICNVDREIFVGLEEHDQAVNGRVLSRARSAA